MGTRGEKDKQRQIQEKCHAVLHAMLRDEDNKYCVDCDSKGPRWASWNLGVFLCIRCAGIHRNLGVHISKVKSVTLDSWTPEQVVSLQQMGNSRARAVYEANLPDQFRRPQSDTNLESFIRAKYEHKKYIAREWVPPPAPKVDWEKEIDEEIEKQKRKKKAQAAGSLADKQANKYTAVPQIPKPKSASPKPARVQQPATAAVSSASTDLLGLQNGEDGFTGFLSGPTPSQPAPTAAAAETKEPDVSSSAKDAARAEEESFFNQPAPSDKEKTKLTKDSILALYGNAPIVPPTATGAAGYQFQNYAPYAQQFPVQNGMQPFQAAPQYQQFPAAQPQFFVQGQGQGQGHFMGAQFPGAAMPGYQPAQFGAAASQFPTAFPPQPAQPMANPFFGAVQQQFSSMSLAGAAQPAAAAKPGPVATNLWQ